MNIQVGDLVSNGKGNVWKVLQINRYPNGDIYSYTIQSIDKIYTFDLKMEFIYKGEWFKI